MEFLREFATFVRELPTRMAIGVSRWGLGFHQPNDVGEEGKPHPFCPTCKVDFPCDDFVKISDRITSTAAGKR